jgi:hypothetical protein
MGYPMSDDIQIKAERYVHDCIVAGGRQPSNKQRWEAVDKIEKYTRELVKALRAS